ncbi:MAG: retropepsin-like aspartic protease, partial [bacterium]
MKLIIKALIFFSFLIFSNQVFAQVFGFEFAEDKKKVVIDIEIYNNLIVIPVTLNNKVPLKFILDTGIRTAILTDKIITDILQVTYDRKIAVQGPGDGRVVEAYVVNNVSLTLPGINGSGQAILVLEEDYLQLSRNLGTEVHGILGYELFSRFVIDINYKGKYITLYKKQFFEPKRKYIGIPISIEDTKPYINANVLFKNGYSIHGKFLIDTGASHAMLLEKQENSNRIPVPQQYVRANLGRGL